MSITRSATTGRAATSAATVPERPSAGAVRASNAEREETVALLHAAVGEGRLDLDEAEERIAAVYGFRYRDELPTVLVDLPPDGAGARSGEAPTWRSIWESVVWRVLMVLHGATVARPTPRQSRAGGVLAAVAALWFLVFVAIGAGVLA